MAFKKLPGNVALLFPKTCSEFLLPLSCSYSQVAEQKSTEEFRVLQLVKTISRRTEVRRARKVAVLPPRTNVMPVDQDWSNVWPGPRSFHPASVPLPLHQGFREKGAAPGKFANAELMKIPNFLHLTPPAVKKHCEALKKFCSPWPENLNEENYSKHFPIEISTSDYCYSSPSIRDPLARIVTLKIKLSVFKFDAHAKDKFLRLVGDRYDPKTGIITITTDRCPFRKQNYDYALYILTALYHEAQKIEPWETEKSLADMEYYDWDKNISRKSVMSILHWPEKLEDSADDSLPQDVQEFKTAMTGLMNEGENDYTLNKYKEAATKLLKLPKFELKSD